MRAGSALLRFGVLALGLIAAGCAHYEWGTSGRLAFATLYISPVKNKTMAPQMSAVTSTSLRENFLGDGRVRLVNSPDDADVTLDVVISGYTREVAAVREQDSGLASKFSITVKTLCTLTDNRTQKALFKLRPIETKRDVFTDNGNPHSSLVGDQLQSEYNTVPLMADSLAKKIVHSVLDVW